MSKRIIQICYRKMIDQQSGRPWERFVFDDSYAEFLMQVQLYNQEKKYYSFSELIRNVPGADKLHFLVSASVTGYVAQLNNVIPDILNTIGKQFLHFQNYRFEIINSDTRNKSAHQVAINFYSDPLLWHDSIGKMLLLSPLVGDGITGEVLTDTFVLPPMTSICSLKTDLL